MRSFLVQPVSILLLLLFITAIAPVVTAGGSPVINATCAALKSLQPYDYCVGVLSADPAAAAATDVRGVAAAAVNITAQKAASTLLVINYLAGDLNTCRGYYSNMLQSLENSLVHFRDGRFLNASLGIANATGDPTGCDLLLFEGKTHKDPISDENYENMRLVDLADGIVDLFANKRLY
ncbi:hypothetical protein BDA96_04G295300 [Sorghum bicolor]|uniref:Pectinesterase inhibitor domain-containing protein n=2 Tax=Sorghum bicolor TaxID=4558 RepID=A0A921R922_SORBI|nr:putative invertase inhibitor [Sorghum bicolor]EES05707.1 hypothetical protein SORBI_3004G277600 [Sorghum bicolor]KAG0534622.1 hypothetical protein BDA96_04G295300 [Sorghum bicolor]WPD91156.1 invertase inhibitor INH2 [Sorghum bicolor]|eukprot:XP_002452731.1 putative invertase inhibitor [Sorghum bicolor]